MGLENFLVGGYKGKGWSIFGGGFVVSVIYIYIYIYFTSKLLFDLLFM